MRWLRRMALAVAARDLIREACEDVEEWGMVSMAKSRLKTLNRKKLVPQEKVWKKFL